MILRKMAVVLLGLSVLLSGCSPDAARDNHSQREDTVNISADANADRKVDNTESTVTDVMPADAGASEVMKEGQGGTAAEENAAGMDIADASQDEGNKIIELIPMKQLPDLTMAPQKPFTLEEAAAFGTHMLTPVYHETFRYQIREFTKHPARLVIDIGNTGNEPLVITDENMWYSILDYEGNEIAGSKLQGAPVSIAPGEIKRVVLTAQNPDAGLVFLELGGLSYTLDEPMFFPVLDDALDVDDTSPYYKYGFTINDDNGEPFIISMHPMQVIGNGRAKMVGCGLMVVENERIGPVDKGDGFLALVKVRIANTSDEVMTIDRLITSGGGLWVDFTEEDMALLGEKGLPYTIEPFTIVEGWVPFRVRDGRDGHGIAFYTSHGGFQLGDLQTYPIFEK
ncbi:MAG TPA: hypothetical protein PK369_10125 [Thermoclostridium sp.]|nr:hypothetical protein [Clostridiaceae bacterium]HOQ76907.1 hypothetical protein [Thermoclostridium sp.]HPU45030.1 hypothetical protein [Thermoclostridium sp.]